jgi:hypothetical protein
MAATLKTLCQTTSGETRSGITYRFLKNCTARS